MQICIERIGENVFLMHFYAIVPDISCTWRTFLPQIIDDFPAVWNYRKLSAKFLVNSVRVIDMVGFLLVFLKFYPNSY